MSGSSSDSESSSASRSDDSSSSSESDSSSAGRHKRRKKSKSDASAGAGSADKAAARKAKKKERSRKKAAHLKRWSAKLARTKGADWWKVGSRYCDDIAGANRRRESLQDRCDQGSWAFTSVDALMAECSSIVECLRRSTALEAHAKATTLNETFTHLKQTHDHNHGRPIVLQQLIAAQLVADGKELKRRNAELKRSESLYKAMARRFGSLAPAPAAVAAPAAVSPVVAAPRQSRERKGKRERTDRACYECGGTDHLAADCTNPRGSGGRRRDSGDRRHSSRRR